MEIKTPISTNLDILHKLIKQINMKPTTNELKTQIQENYSQIEKLEKELDELCLYPESLYAKKIKAERIFFNHYLKNPEDKNGRVLLNQNK